MSAARADDLLRRLVELAESSANASSLGEHVDPEDLTLFVAGEIPEAARTPIIEHLASCRECRVWAAELLKQEAEAASPQAISISSARTSGWFTSSRTWLAAAAAILLLVSVAAIYWPGRSRLTEQTAYVQAKQQLVAGRFDDAQATLAQARRQEINSDRLRSLQAQSIRRIPDSLALARAGRLSDFGYEIGGIVARDPAHQAFGMGLANARQQLGDEASRDLELLLNRGHLYLSLNEPALAGRDFAAAAQVAPRDPLVWLGQGLAAFLDDDFATAEEAFRRATELDPANLAANINLAMALEEQDKRTEAAAQWRKVLDDKSLAPDERAQIEAAVRMLEKN